MTCAKEYITKALSRNRRWKAAAKGVARLLDLWGVVGKRRVPRDVDALRRDWLSVEQDFEAAMSLTWRQNGADRSDSRQRPGQ